MTQTNDSPQSWQWRVRSQEFDLRRKTLVMGILNLTPDSFSDGGQFADSGKAIEHGVSMLAGGADIIDIGAESTRPSRTEEMTPELEWQRLEPVISGLRAHHPGCVLSVDTYRGETAERALAAGVDIINDIFALRRSPEIARYCAAHGAGLILMHMQGTPETMQENPTYDNVLADIRQELRTAMDTAMAAGLPEQCIAVDPGIGFGKNLDHNIEILAGLEYLRLMQRPICVGASRKWFLGKLTGDQPVTEREEQTIAAHCAAVLHGATIIRTHNVKAAVRSLAVIDAIRAQSEF